MLEDVRVLDFCHFLAGPYCTMVLADLGADVVKVEDPARPDEARQIGPGAAEGQSYYFTSLNRGKRSVAVPFGSPSGRDTVLALARTADVVIDNFKPGVMARLGLAHDSLAAVNDRLVTCSLTGFGETGPYRQRAGYDYTIQALAGVMSMTGEPDGPPGKAGLSYVDHSGGLAAALVITSALVERGRTGVGRHLDVSLFDVQASMLTYLASWHLNTGYQPVRIADGAHPSLVPAQNFETSDGHVSLFVGNDAMWARLVKAVGVERLADPAFATLAGRTAARGTLIPLLQGILRSDTTTAWATRFEEATVPCAPVNSLAEALADPQLHARGLVVDTVHPDHGPVRSLAGPFPTSATPSARPAPALGEHTVEILAEIS